MPVRHIVSVNDFTSDDLSLLFDRALQHKRDFTTRPKRDLSRTTVINLFYEASTRTRASFAIAAQEIGCRVFSTENAKEFSSGAKGENLKDTLETASRYCLVRGGGGVIVVRHDEDGLLEAAKHRSFVPVINAGDGANEHPTQAVLDFFTIWEACMEERIPRVGLKVHFYGDNAKARTARSLLRLLARYAKAFDIDIEGFYAGGPWEDRKHFAPELVMEAEHYGYEVRQGCAIGSVDAHVVYLNRKQKERGQEGEKEVKTSEKNDTSFCFTLAHAESLPEKAIIMHPLPRVNELAEEVDDNPRAAYFNQQVVNGVYVRMALLEMLLEAL